MCSRFGLYLVLTVYNSMDHSVVPKGTRNTAQKSRRFTFRIEIDDCSPRWKSQGMDGCGRLRRYSINGQQIGRSLFKAMNSFEELMPRARSLLLRETDASILKPSKDSPQFSAHCASILCTATIVDRTCLQSLEVFDRRVGTVFSNRNP